MRRLCHFVIIASLIFAQNAFAVRADVKRSYQKIQAEKEYLKSIEGQIANATSRNQVIEILNGAVDTSFAKINEMLPTMSHKRAERVYKKLTRELIARTGDSYSELQDLVGFSSEKTAKENLASLASEESRIAIGESIARDLPQDIDAIKAEALKGLYAKKAKNKINRKPARKCKVNVHEPIVVAAVVSAIVPVLGWIVGVVLIIIAVPVYAIFDWPRGCEVVDF